jgi:NADH dehydrogenase
MTEYSHLGNGARGTKLERQQGDPAIKQCNPPDDWSSNDRSSAQYHQPARYKPFVAYQDHGSLVSLSRFSTVGSLMGNLVGGRMFVEGWIARMVYMSLYRMHLIAIHGWWRGVMLIVIGHVNQIVRPRLKLH